LLPLHETAARSPVNVSRKPVLCLWDSFLKYRPEIWIIWGCSHFSRTIELNIRIIIHTCFWPFQCNPLRSLNNPRLKE
jgi:hypothetical protein